MLYKLIIVYGYETIYEGIANLSSQDIIRFYYGTFYRSDRSKYDIIYDKDNRCPKSWYI
jgi:hypothetical protein